MAYLVQNFSLIIFLKSILVYLVPPTHKLAKTFKKIDFQLLFSRDWDIFGTNGYKRWTRLKKFFKLSISCFVRKKSPNGLNLAVSRSPNSWCLVIDENFLKNRLNMAYFVQNFPLIIFMKSILVYLVPPTHKLAKTAEKSSKWPYFGVNFLETGTEIEKSVLMVTFVYLFYF